jgi:hypothetical protein
MAVLMYLPDKEVAENRQTYLVVLKRTGAAAGVEIGRVLAPNAFTKNTPLTLTVLSDGTWSASVDLGGLKTVSGQDSDFATGGVLASGKPGIYDARVSSSAVTRTIDKFNCLSAAEAGRVCFASKKAEVRWDETERQDATGTYYGEPSSYRGDRFFVPVGNSRLALKMRRNDIDLEPDANVTDKQEVEVKITERVLAPQ